MIEKIKIRKDVLFVECVNCVHPYTRYSDILNIKEDILHFEDREWRRSGHSHKTEIKSTFSQPVILFLDKFVKYIKKKHPEIKMDILEQTLKDPDIIIRQKRNQIETRVAEKVIDGKIYRVVLRKMVETRAKKKGGPVF